jgi:hypothetical protein
MSKVEYRNLVQTKPGKSLGCLAELIYSLDVFVLQLL